MAYRYGDRYQMGLLPASIEDYVPKDSPVRAYDAFVDALDFGKLGIIIDPHQVGNPAYDPKAMLKLLVFGYSYGVRSSRKLEREANNNIAFIWLLGGLKPDFKAIAEFRRYNLEALKNVLRQCARLCIKLGLIEGNTLFVDGTKIRANASIKNTWTKERCEKRLEKIDERIGEILAECETADREEEGCSSLVSMGEELADEETLKAKVKSILEELKAEGKEAVNTTDPDCAKMRSIQGKHAAYNVQAVVDGKNGLIVSSDAVSENNDTRQFATQIEKAQETTEKQCVAACADAGYSCMEEIEKIDAKGIKAVVPSQRQALKDKSEKPFDKSHFTYDLAKDCYICPEGKELKYNYTNTAKKCKVYRAGPVCRRCRYFGTCTTHKARGRGITRLLLGDLQEKIERQYEEPESQRIYSQRKERSELPFGHIKRNLHVDGFLLRGLAGVKAEASLFAVSFNMARMISILGVAGLVAALGG
jgi:transposase